MIIWSGTGFFIAAFISLAWIFCKWLFKTFWSVGYYSAHSWTTGVTFILAAIMSLALVYALRKESFLLWLAKITASQPMYQADLTHKFFFIPVRYWPLILFLFGAGLCIREWAGF
ncbi:hypothetical protein [Pseudomonas cerasi]